MPRWRKPRLIRAVILGILGVVTLGAAIILAAWLTVCRNNACPSLDALGDYDPAQASKLYAADGRLITDLGLERRTVVPLNEISPAVIQAFLNFLATPPQYADFVNTTGTAYMMPAATPLVEKTISQNPILVPTDAILAKTEFDKYLGADGTTLWSNTWTAIKAA